MAPNCNIVHRMEFAEEELDGIFNSPDSSEELLEGSQQSQPDPTVEVNQQPLLNQESPASPEPYVHLNRCRGLPCLDPDDPAYMEPEPIHDEPCMDVQESESENVSESDIDNSIDINLYYNPKLRPATFEEMQAASRKDRERTSQYSYELVGQRGEINVKTDFWDDLKEKVTCYKGTLVNGCRFCTECALESSPKGIIANEVHFTLLNELVDGRNCHKCKKHLFQPAIPFDCSVCRSRFFHHKELIMLGVRLK